MYVLTTKTSGWKEGPNTDVRVEFEDEAKAEADKWSGPGENMLEKCVWRFLSEHLDDLEGASVTFRLNQQDVLGLVERLRTANSESVN